MHHDPVVEIADLARKVARLRRWLLFLHGAIVAASLVMLRSPSHVPAIAFLVTCLFALAVSKRMWNEMVYLCARSRWLASRRTR